jgi:hypothetical protein
MTLYLNVIHHALNSKGETVVLRIESAHLKSVLALKSKQDFANLKVNLQQRMKMLFSVVDYASLIMPSLALPLMKKEEIKKAHRCAF